MSLSATPLTIRRGVAVAVDYCSDDSDKSRFADVYLYFNLSSIEITILKQLAASIYTSLYLLLFLNLY